MKRLLIVLSISSAFFTCSRTDPASDNNTSGSREIQSDQGPSVNRMHYLQVDTTREIRGDQFYQFVQLTDSTAIIKWGDKSTGNISNTAVHSDFLSKDKIYLSWSTTKFMTLHRSTGSDTWIDIVLPMSKGEDLRFYENCLGFDKENGIAVCEWPGESDTVLLAENIMTRKKQALGKSWKKCGAVSFVHYCIDSISVIDKTLYLEWILPHKLEKQITKEIKRVRLDV